MYGEDAGTEGKGTGKIPFKPVRGTTICTTICYVKYLDVNMTVLGENSSQRQKKHKT